MSPQRMRDGRWRVWLGVLFVLAVLVASGWRIGRWLGSGPSAANTRQTVRAVADDDLNAVPGDRHLQRTVTGLYITRANVWSYAWSYNCGLAGFSASAIRIELQHMTLPQHGRTPRVLGSRVLYDVGQFTTQHPVGGTFEAHGAGAYRFIITIPRACIWSIAAPPLGLVEGRIHGR